MTVHRALLAGQDWLGHGDVHRLFRAFEPHPLRFVGGAVRDALLGRPVHDMDFATPLRPERIMEVLEAADIHVATPGLAHGTVLALFHKRACEITTLRQDVATDGRHAEVSYVDDWHTDALRRDFTLNALYADEDGTVHDYVDGLSDLRAGRVRFIGDARLRIEEDYLRILRFFRFHAWYAATPIDAASLSACAGLREGLRTLSGERVWAEFYRLLQAPLPVAALTHMEETGVLHELAPEIASVAPLAVIEASFPPDPLTRLAVLLANKDAAHAFCQRLPLTSAQSKRLSAAFTPPAAPIPPPSTALSPPRLRHALYALTAPTFCDQLALTLPAPSSVLRDMLHTCQTWQPPVFPLKGRHLLALGAASGPAVGKRLRRLEERWIASDFQLSLDELLALLDEPERI